jgi:RNA-binding protein
MLNSKDRATLKKLANGYDPLIYIGKDGISQTILDEAEVLLEKRELIKVCVQRGCELTPREVCDAFCEQLKCEPVLVVGKRFIIYREAKEESKNLI